ncbi:helix-turn-helix domain-containing protein [Thermodesulfobacteriota bacterium]
MNLALKTAILRSGIKQKAIAARAGISPWRLSRIINDGQVATHEECTALARELDVCVQVLFPEADRPAVA